ncbi:MAG: hypothetical protein ACXABY_22725 [Candidatus Thorarchaeota archaeon]|jgi:hypothetical protein
MQEVRISFYDSNNLELRRYKVEVRGKSSSKIYKTLDDQVKASDSFAIKQLMDHLEKELRRFKGFKKIVVVF